MGMRMRGDAKSIDVNMLLYENEKMLCKITNFTDYAEDKFESIEKNLQKVEKALGVEVCSHTRRFAGEAPPSATADRRKSYTSRLENAVSVLAACEHTEGEGAFPLSHEPHVVHLST